MTGTGSPASIRAPRDVVWIARRLEEAGYQAWTVGGAVRDVLAGIEPEDWDLTTSAPPARVQRLFRRTVPVGVDHGTIGVIAPGGRMFEVTTFRRDVETYGRRARVAFAERLEEDLERRDFTINAVAWHPVTGELRDPHNGIRDLQLRVLRTVGDPEKRFAEDRLRVLRALRFAGRFGLRIDEATWNALCSSATLLENLSPERVREELFKVLAGQRLPGESLRLYAESGVLRALYPELDRCRNRPAGRGAGDLWEHMVRTVDAASSRHLRVRLAGLLHRVGDATDLGPLGGDPSRAGGEASAAISRTILVRLRSSNADIDTVTHLVAHHRPVPLADSPAPELKRWMRRVGAAYLNDLFRLLAAICRAEGGAAGDLRRLHIRVRALRRQNPPLSVADLAIGGRELAGLGIPRGPIYGEILRDLLERVTEDPELNRRDALLAIVREALEWHR